MTTRSHTKDDMKTHTNLGCVILLARGCRIARRRTSTTVAIKRNEHSAEISPTSKPPKAN